MNLGPNDQPVRSPDGAASFLARKGTQIAAASLVAFLAGAMIGGSARPASEASASEPAPTVTAAPAATADAAQEKSAAPPAKHAGGLLTPGAYIMGEEVQAGRYKSVSPLEGTAMFCDAEIKRAGEFLWDEYIWDETIYGGQVIFDIPEADGAILEIGAHCPDLKKVK